MVNRIAPTGLRQRTELVVLPCRSCHHLPLLIPFIKSSVVFVFFFSAKAIDIIPLAHIIQPLCQFSVMILLFFLHIPLW
jgi:hypothetical protein